MRNENELNKMREFSLKIATPDFGFAFLEDQMTEEQLQLLDELPLPEDEGDAAISDTIRNHDWIVYDLIDTPFWRDLFESSEKLSRGLKFAHYFLEGNDIPEGGAAEE